MIKGNARRAAIAAFAVAKGGARIGDPLARFGVARMKAHRPGAPSAARMAAIRLLPRDAGRSDRVALHVPGERSALNAVSEDIGEAKAERRQAAGLRRQRLMTSAT